MRKVTEHWVSTSFSSPVARINRFKGMRLLTYGFLNLHFVRYNVSISNVFELFRWTQDVTSINNHPLYISVQNLSIKNKSSLRFLSTFCANKLNEADHQSRAQRGRIRKPQVVIWIPNFKVLIYNTLITSLSYTKFPWCCRHVFLISHFVIKFSSARRNFFQCSSMYGRYCSTTQI